MVSQSSTYVNPDPKHPTHGPEMAIDGDENTLAHTNCGDGANNWYRIVFGKVYIVTEVEFINHFINQNNNLNGLKTRMDGTRVLITNKKKEELCETLHVPAEDTRQIYSINCRDKMGDGVILRGKEGNADACIHIEEIAVFGAPYGESVDLSPPYFLRIFLVKPISGQTYFWSDLFIS